MLLCLTRSDENGGLTPHTLFFGAEPSRQELKARKPETRRHRTTEEKGAKTGNQRKIAENRRKKARKPETEGNQRKKGQTSTNQQFATQCSPSGAVADV